MAYDTMWPPWLRADCTVYFVVEVACHVVGTWGLHEDQIRTTLALFAHPLNKTSSSSYFCRQ